jgi:hypothetical protein
MREMRGDALAPSCDCFADSTEGKMKFGCLSTRTAHERTMSSSGRDDDSYPFEKISKRWRLWRGLRGGCGWSILPLTRLWDEWIRVRHAAMACTAGDGVGRLVIAQLCEEFSVEVVGHFDHQAGFFFDRVCIGGEVVASGRRVSGVTEFALDAEVALILMHELDDVVSGDVFGKSLDVGWIGTRPSGWSCGLACRSGGWSVLSEGEVSGERDKTHYEERTTMGSIHIGRHLFCMRCGRKGVQRSLRRGRFFDGAGELRWWAWRPPVIALR